MSFKRLLPLEEARRVIETNYTPADPVVVERGLDTALGYVLAEDIRSEIDVPGFDRSTVDGYAVRSQDLIGAGETSPRRLLLAGSVEVGFQPPRPLSAGECIAVPTGGAIPRGADAVVMKEYAHVEEDHVTFYRGVGLGENTMKRGADIARGETVCTKQTVLTSREIGLLAALGLERVKVFRKPVVALISTGNEVQNIGEIHDEYRVYDINSHALSALLREVGAEPLPLGVARDDYDAIRHKIICGLELADLILTSGSTSAGSEDLIPTILESFGPGGLIFSGVAIKPGKPTTFGLPKGKPVFALPGHPTSAVIAFHLLVRPLLARLSGRRAEEPRTYEAKLEQRAFPAKGRQTFIPVTLRREKGELIARPISGESGAISSYARADGFFEIPSDVQQVLEGSRVKVHILR
jgi:molybdenum cofactor synthesis domain-containing protein